MPDNVQVAGARITFRADTDQMVRELRAANTALRQQVFHLKSVQTQAASTTTTLGGLTLAFTRFIGPLAGIAGVYAFSRGVSSAAAWGAQMVETARQTSLLTEELQLLDRVARGDGLQSRTLIKGLSTLSKAIADAQRGTSTYVQAIRSLGLSVSELASADQLQRLRLIGDAIGRIGIDASAFSVQTLLGGRAGVQLAPILGRGSVALDQSLADAAKFGVVSGEAAENLKALDQSFLDLGETLSTSWNTFVADISPALMNFASNLTDVVLAIDEFKQGIGDFLKSLDIGISNEERARRAREDTLTASEGFFGPGLIEFRTVTNFFRNAASMAGEELADLADTLGLTTDEFRQKLREFRTYDLWLRSLRILPNEVNQRPASDFYDRLYSGGLEQHRREIPLPYSIYEGQPGFGFQTRSGRELTRLYKERQEEEARQIEEASKRRMELRREIAVIEIKALTDEFNMISQGFSRLQEHEDRAIHQALINVGRFAPRGGAFQSRLDPLSEEALGLNQESLQLQKDIAAEAIRAAEKTEITWMKVGDSISNTISSNFSTLGSTIVLDMDNAQSAWNSFARSIQQTLLNLAFDPTGAALGQVIGGAVSGLGNYIGGQIGGTGGVPLPPTKPSLAGGTTVNVNNRYQITGSDEVAVRNAIERSRPSIVADVKGAITQDFYRPSAIRSATRR